MMLMKPISNGWVVFAWPDQGLTRASLVEVIGIYTDAKEALQIVEDLHELGMEAWAESAAVDKQPIKFKIEDSYVRGTVFTGKIVLGSSNDITTRMVLHHGSAGTLQIKGVERMGTSPVIGLRVSGWEDWDKEHPIEGLICTIKEKR
jgi:hypothetical protein